MVRNPSAVAGTMGVPARPVIRRIGYDDLRAALSEGWRDFRETPTQLVFLGVIYPLVGFVAARAAFGYELLPLLFPMLAGISLLGPVAALGLYEISRRRERGEPASWVNAFDVLRSPSLFSIAALGVVLFAIFVAWLFVAKAIYVATLGAAPPDSMGEFLRDVLRTREGRSMILLGNGAGFFFALLVLSISAVSFPLLLDRGVGVAEAVRASMRAMATNPGPMLGWGLAVAVLLVLGSLPCFVGLAVVMPVLGHATWHLYRRLVA